MILKQFEEVRANYVPILGNHKSFFQMDHQVDIGPLHSVYLGNHPFWTLS
jgi:hypothetical protein